LAVLLLHTRRNGNLQASSYSYDNIITFNDPDFYNSGIVWQSTYVLSHFLAVFIPKLPLFLFLVYMT